MKKQYHILNGDALKEQLPSTISGDIIIARECLVDGPVKASSLDDLFAVRAKFISQAYGEYTTQDYFEHSVTEFQKILSITEDAEINLWFEDDLFCQVNFWFCCNLLYQSDQQNQVYLIRPEASLQYGFGGLSKEELTEAFQNRTLLPDLDNLASLWMHYQREDHEQLLSATKGLAERYPFILPAVEAHMERVPSGGNPGRPVQALVQIINELRTNEFGTIFQEFNKRESIYGFGDLQVRRLLTYIEKTARR